MVPEIIGDYIKALYFLQEFAFFLFFIFVKLYSSFIEIEI